MAETVALTHPDSGKRKIIGPGAVAAYEAMGYVVDGSDPEPTKSPKTKRSTSTPATPADPPAFEDAESESEQ